MSTKTKLFSKHILVEAANIHGNAPALIDSNITLSYLDLLNRSTQIGGAMADRGLPPGSIIVLDDLGNYQMIISLWACLLYGFVAFPLNTRFPVTELQSLLATTAPALVLSDRNLVPGRSFTVMEVLADAELSLPPIPETIDPNRAATLLMTSGSSGMSKVVQHSTSNHLFSAQGSNENIPLGAGDRWLLTLPLYHVGGLSLLFRTALAGATTVIPALDQTLIESMETFSPSHISLVATQLKRLLDDISPDKKRPSIKAVLLGGSAIPQSLVRRAVEQGLPVHLSYGSTEMASQITTTRMLANSHEPYNSGQVLASRDILISHEGEILTRGATLAQGYLQNGIVQDLTGEDGWFHTGDVGFIDFQGALTVTGRVDNQFISGGENIQPEHIERALTSNPAILQALVLPEPDPEFGQKPVAYLQLGSDLLKTELINYLSTMLPRYMIPKAYFILPDSIFSEDLKLTRQTISTFLRRANNPLRSLD